MSVAIAPVVLADLMPKVRLRAALLVATAVALTAACAQISIHTLYTPVPITGQTFAVLLTAGVLGVRKAVLSQLVYVALGAVGMPIYAAGSGGWAAATGASAGYLVGFVIAAAVVGALAERRHDRSLLTCVPAMLAGTAAIYAAGCIWLAHSLGVPGTKAIELGLVPFIIGDTLKLLLAGVSLRSAWVAVEKFDPSQH